MLLLGWTNEGQSSSSDAYTNWHASLFNTVRSKLSI